MRHHTPLTAFALALACATLPAQTPASFTYFGEGCNGGTVSNSLTLNDTNPTMTVASLPNEYAYPVVNTTGQAIQIVGYEIFTTTNTGLTETVKTGLLYDLAGPTATVHSTPAAQNVANGTITVNPVQGWYSTSVYPPITIQPGVAFWFHCDAYAKVAPPQHVTGGATGPVSNYYRRPTNNMVWTVSVSVARQIFRIHCLPATPTVPSLLASSLPQLGNTFTLNVAGGDPFLPGFVIYAFSRTQWLAWQTPVDLAMFGAPTCFNQTSSDIPSLLLLDQSGQGSLGFAIPASTSYSGFTFHTQAAVITPAANSLGMLVSNAGTAVIGL